jgi:lipoyl synthase
MQLSSSHQPHKRHEDILYFKESQMICHVYQLGLVSYDQALELQKRLNRLRVEREISDTLLILEHPSTITLGKSADRLNILATETELAQRGIAVCTSDRGGDVTYHCPGQLVAYPVIDLRIRSLTVRGYINMLEELGLQTLDQFGIEADRWTEHPGLWVNGKQIAAIGLHLSRWITTHGLALNVNPELEPFKLINLCGLPGKEATSMAKQLCKEIAVSDVAPRLLESFARVFNVEFESASLQEIGEILGTEPASLV